MFHRHVVAAALVAAAGFAQAEDVEGDAAREAKLNQARQACLDAAKALGIRATKVEHLSMVGNQGELNARLAVAGRKDLNCRYNPADGSTVFPGVSDNRPGTASNAVVRACQAVADRKDIRLGSFDSLKELDGRRIQVRFDRPPLGRRHTCVYDQREKTVAFDGGKPVDAPSVATPR